MEWISIKDRKPEYGQRIVYCGKRVRFGCGIMFVQDQNPINNIEYWFPVPESPIESYHKPFKNKYCT